MQEFKVPELGENVEQGDVTRLLVKVGDTISREQPVVELETDKATIEVPSSVAGVVKDIKVKAGDKVKVGAVIAWARQPLILGALAASMAVAFVVSRPSKRAREIQGTPERIGVRWGVPPRSPRPT